jgi:glycosyltransferase involved in cell wall biosynthesis
MTYPYRKISNKSGNCSQHNCINNVIGINKTQNHSAQSIHISEFVANTENSQKLCTAADIIVIERNYFGDTLTIIQYWKVRGKTIIGIFDDAYQMMHPKNVSYGFWNRGEVKLVNEKGGEQVVYMKPIPLEQFKWGLRLFKALQMPSYHLADDWKEYCPTYYIHNHLDIEKYQNVTPLLPHDGLVIGWCGSMSHYDSFATSGVLTALKKIGKSYPKIKFLFGGDKRIFDLVEVDNKVHHPYVPAEQWSSLLKTIDIGIAPLHGEYDKRRSWIKALEHLALKTPCIASDLPTYNELHDYIKITPNGSKWWETAIVDMIENYSIYKEKADTIGYDFAVSQSIDNNIEETIALYQKIVTMPYPEHFIKLPIDK